MMTGRRYGPSVSLVALLLLQFHPSYAWLTFCHCENQRFSSILSKSSNFGSGPFPTFWRQDTASFRLYAKKYDLGLGKNRPRGEASEDNPLNVTSASANWNTPTPVEKPHQSSTPHSLDDVKKQHQNGEKLKSVTTKKIVARTEEARQLRGAVWDEEHYQASLEERGNDNDNDGVKEDVSWISDSNNVIKPPSLLYPDIDLSIPASVYDPSSGTDAIWELLRYEAYRESQREPLLVSFLYSTILNHDSLESALAFHLANRLSSPAMISTQIQSLIMEALENSLEFRKSLRADVMAVRDRDPACTGLPDAFLYFKGLAALQCHRVAHYLYRSGRQVLAHYLQSQASTNFQIDIHPNATLGSGIMLDHGTGIVIGETAIVGNNCSILHHVTLGGSGRRGNDRHPKIGSGVLLGAGASVLGNVCVGDGCQVGAGTLVISDLPPHSVAVGVPAKIIGSFVDVTGQPSISMNQMTGTRDFDENIITFESGGI